MRVVAVADTHLRSGAGRGLPHTLLAEVERADVVLHAGDLVDSAVLDQLNGHAPTHAVLGNNDHDLAGILAEHMVLDLDGVRVGMVHDSGPRQGRARRLRTRFPDAGLVVFGHSHIPWNAPGLEGQWLLNPGSPTQRRSQPHPTFATLELVRGQIASVDIVVIEHTEDRRQCRPNGSRSTP